MPDGCILPGMKQVNLRPMTEEEFAHFKVQTLDTYANSLAQAHNIPLSLAKDRSEASIMRLLPQGLGSPNQYLFIAEHAGKKIGHLWYGKDDNSAAWIYDIEVLSDYRRQGLGRAILHAFENDAKARGFARLGLHVFAYNQQAHQLYRSFGFLETGIVMKKELDA